MRGRAIRASDIADAISILKLDNSEVCIHSSMRSFGCHREGGADRVIDSFLEMGCTIMVPTFSDQYEACPIFPYMPAQNGAGDYSYFQERKYASVPPFDVTSREISAEDMGSWREKFSCVKIA